MTTEMMLNKLQQLQADQGFMAAVRQTREPREIAALFADHGFDVREMPQEVVRLAQCTTASEAVVELNRQGRKVTMDEFAALQKQYQAQAMDELDEESLEAVAGGRSMALAGTSWVMSIGYAACAVGLVGLGAAAAPLAAGMALLGLAHVALAGVATM